LSQTADEKNGSFVPTRGGDTTTGQPRATPRTHGGDCPRSTKVVGRISSDQKKQPTGKKKKGEKRGRGKLEHGVGKPWVSKRRGGKKKKKHLFGEKKK